MSELTWAAASCVDWLFSCMSFCAFEKFIDDTYNRVERRVNAVKSFLFLTSHTAWMVNFVLNLLLLSLLSPIKWWTTPNFIQAWPSWRYAVLQFALVMGMQRLDCRWKWITRWTTLLFWQLWIWEKSVVQSSSLFVRRRMGWWRWKVTGTRGRWWWPCSKWSVNRMQWNCGFCLTNTKLPVPSSKVGCKRP